jgi:hypothetical protein
MNISYQNTLWAPLPQILHHSDEAPYPKMPATREKTREIVWGGRVGPSVPISRFFTYSFATYLPIKTSPTHLEHFFARKTLLRHQTSSWTPAVMPGSDRLPRSCVNVFIDGTWRRADSLNLPAKIERFLFTSRPHLEHETRDTSHRKKYKQNTQKHQLCVLRLRKKSPSRQRPITFVCYFKMFLLCNLSISPNCFTTFLKAHLQPSSEIYKKSL